MQAGGSEAAAASAAATYRGLRSRSGPACMGEINVTPLVDVVLVLLLVFMVTAPMMSRGIDVSLPVANQPQIDAGGPRHGLDQRRRARLRRRQAGEHGAARGPAARADWRAGPSKVVYLRADEGLRYGKVIEVVDKIKQRGRRADRVRLRAARGEARAVNDPVDRLLVERQRAGPRASRQRVLVSLVGHLVLVGRRRRRCRCCFRASPPLQGRRRLRGRRCRAAAAAPRAASPRPRRPRAAAGRRARPAAPPPPPPQGPEAAEGRAAARACPSSDAEEAGEARAAARAREPAPPAPRRPRPGGVAGRDRARRADARPRVRPAGPRRARRHRQRRRLVPGRRAAEDLDDLDPADQGRASRSRSA